MICMVTLETCFLKYLRLILQNVQDYHGKQL